MSLLFSISEGINSLRRLPTSAGVAILILALAISLVGAGAIIGLNGARLVRYIKSQYDLSVFVKMSVPNDYIRTIGDAIRKIEGVEKVVYVSPDDAAERYKIEFGENVMDVLGYNPFPSSYVVSINSEYGSAAEASLIVRKIESMDEIEEVEYEKAILVAADKYLRVLIMLGLIVGGIVVAAAILISANTIKLTIYAKRELIRTMRLVGATDAFIRRPFIIEGILEGFLAGVLSIVIIEGSYRLTAKLLGDVLPIYRVEITLEIYAGMVALGIFLGIMGSALSVRRFLREIV